MLVTAVCVLFLLKLDRDRNPWPGAYNSTVGSFSNDNGDGNENVTNLHI